MKPTFLIVILVSICLAWVILPVDKGAASGIQDATLETQLRETNRQLKRIADALEIIAGTGTRQWKAPK